MISFDVKVCNGWVQSKAPGDSNVNKTRFSQRIKRLFRVHKRAKQTSIYTPTPVKAQMCKNSRRVSICMAAALLVGPGLSSRY